MILDIRINYKIKYSNKNDAVYGEEEIKQLYKCVGLRDQIRISLPS
jgi:hypothetical protein